MAIEPDDALFRMIKALLAVEYYEVIQQIDPAPQADADLILIDIAPPYGESLETLGFLRAKTGTPTIAISATTDDSVRRGTVESGADDFVNLPFEPDELVSHVRFLLDEQKEVDSGRSPLVAGGLEIDFNRRAVRLAGASPRLSYSEWLLLDTMALQPGQPCLMAELLTTAWGPSVKHDYQFLKQWISRLQVKLGCDPRNPRWIRPYHDVGYTLST